jgi:hypothetical protein
MEKTALNRFLTELRKWITAHNKIKGFTTDADQTFTALETRLGSERLAQIGSALINGWLATEDETDRGYFVRETDRPGRRGGRFTMINRGDGKADPCWELFVQLADYAWLRTIAERHGQTVRLEDRLMDLTVRSGNDLVLYVEHKLSRALATRLLEEMRAYGKTGFNLDVIDKGNDPLRKAKYLVRDSTSRPLYFGLSAVGYRQLFSIEYGEGNRFQLLEDDRPFSAPLVERPAKTGTTLEWSPVDALAIEISRLCPTVWISVGTGRTAYNFYAPTGASDAIIIGLLESGDVWTDLAGLGKERAERFSAALAKTGIVLDASKTWTRWKAVADKLDLTQVNATAIAEAVREALSIGLNAKTAASD